MRYHDSVNKSYGSPKMRCLIVYLNISGHPTGGEAKLVGNHEAVYNTCQCLNVNRDYVIGRKEHGLP